MSDLEQNIGTEAVVDTVVDTSVEAVTENVTEAVTENVTDQVEQHVSDAVASSNEVINNDLGFLGTLSEDIRSNTSLQDFKDADGLAKSYLELNKLLGKRMEDMSPEELNSYYGKLGRPDDASGYDLGDVQGDISDWYKDIAHSAGLSQEQAKNISEAYNQLEASKMAEMQEQQKETMGAWVDQLKEEFGSAFDTRIQAAQAAVKTYGGEELKNFLNETGLGNHPAMVKAFADIGKELGEDALVGSNSTGGFGTTPDEALKKISMLKKDPEFMDQYLARGKYSKASTQHRDAVKEMQELFGLAYNK